MTDEIDKAFKDWLKTQFTDETAIFSKFFMGRSFRAGVEFGKKDDRFHEGVLVGLDMNIVELKKRTDDDSLFVKEIVNKLYPDGFPFSFSAFDLRMIFEAGRESVRIGEDIDELRCQIGPLYGIIELKEEELEEWQKKVEDLKEGTIQLKKKAYIDLSSDAYEEWMKAYIDFGNLINSIFKTNNIKSEGNRMEGKKFKNGDMVYHVALEKGGKNAQKVIPLEECAELIQAIIKDGCKVNGSTIEEIKGELADVEIMLNQMRIIYGDWIEQKDTKLNRLKGMLGLNES